MEWFTLFYPHFWNVSISAVHFQCITIHTNYISVHVACLSRRVFQGNALGAFFWKSSALLFPSNRNLCCRLNSRFATSVWTFSTIFKHFYFLNASQEGKQLFFRLSEDKCVLSQGGFPWSLALLGCVRTETLDNLRWGAAPRSGSPPGMIAVMVFSNLVFNSWVLQPPTWVSTGFFLYVWVSWGGRRGVGCICMKIQQSWEAFAPVKLATFPTQQTPAGAALRTSEASVCFLVGGAAAVAWSLGLGHGLIQVAMQTELRFCWRDHKEQGQFTTSHSFPCIFRQDKNISFYIHHYYHPDDYKDTEL